MIRKLRHTRRKPPDGQPEAPLRRKRARLHEPLDISVVEVLVRNTTSQDAILRFMTMVLAWRRASDDIRGRLLQVGKCDESHRPEALDTLRTARCEDSQLFSFLEVLTSVHLVRNLECRITTVPPKASNAQSNDRSTALIWASEKGHEAVVRLLIDKGADVNAQSNAGLTALLLASRNGHEAVARLLIDKGADVKASDKCRSTALVK